MDILLPLNTNHNHVKIGMVLKEANVCWSKGFDLKCWSDPPNESHLGAINRHTFLDMRSVQSPIKISMLSTNYNH